MPKCFGKATEEGKMCEACTKEADEFAKDFDSEIIKAVELFRPQKEEGKDAST